jgi:hypothetical protein
MVSRPWCLAVMIALPAFIGIALFSGGGTIDREATLFVLQYTGDRSVLQKVFDPHANDLGTYQARELSYLADYIDANVYAFLYRAFGFVFLIPLSAAIATVLLAGVFFAGVARTSRIGRVTAVLLFGCFASSFVFVSTMAVFYRSGKALLSVALLALLFQIRSLHQGRESDAPSGPLLSRAGLTVAGLAIVMGLLDRQGFFYVAALAVMLATHYYCTGQLRDLVIILIASLILLQLYNIVVAPIIIHAVNGYWPDLSYQALPSEHLPRLPIYAVLATSMLAENAVRFAGGSGWLAAPLVVAISAGLLVTVVMRAPPGKRRRELTNTLAWQPNRRVVMYGLLATSLQVLMFALMITRHPQVYVALDHRYFYYPLPFMTTLLFGALVLIDAVEFRVAAGMWIVRTSLLVALLGNILTLPHHMRVMKLGAWFGEVSSQTAALKHALANNTSVLAMQTEYARFVRYHRAVRSR